jgi:hypothetical protein
MECPLAKPCDIIVLHVSSNKVAQKWEEIQAWNSEDQCIVVNKVSCSLGLYMKSKPEKIMFLLWLKRSWCTTSLEAKYQLLKGFSIKLWNKATNTTAQILIVFLRCCKKMKSLIVLLRRYLFAFHRSNQNVRPTSGGTCACLVCPAWPASLSSSLYRLIRCQHVSKLSLTVLFMSDSLRTV